MIDNKMNFSFEICFDHNKKIRFNDIKNNKAKPSDYHIILSDAVSNHLDTYLAPYLVHSSTDSRNSGLFVWNKSSYVKHHPCSYASISNSITNAKYKVKIHYSYSYTDKQNLNNNINLLFSALNNNDVKTIADYIKRVLSVNLSHLEKEKILMAKGSDGTPGLLMALNNGHAAAIEAYIDGIKNIPMINKDLLLAAKRNDGKSGLFMALENGHVEAVKAYIEGIQNATKVNKEVLLAAKDSNNTPWLSRTLQNATYMEEVVAQYLQIEDTDQKIAHSIMSSIKGSRKNLKNKLLEWSRNYNPNQIKLKKNYKLLISLLSQHRATILKVGISDSVKELDRISHWQ
ncbi:hypothetical protein IB642_00650 [Allofrancisella guangzhouensis]|nr:hypothetical protein [Allofrancisella guangzhouensis]